LEKNWDKIEILLDFSINLISDNIDETSTYLPNEFLEYFNSYENDELKLLIFNIIKFSKIEDYFLLNNKNNVFLFY
jgi:hypothetical protein